MDKVELTAESSPNEQPSEMPNPVNLNSLSLDKVSIHYTYLLEKASVGQIMKRLSNLAIKDPKNIYQETLNEYFKTAVPKLVNAYNEMLKSSTYEEYVVKDYNLLGNLPRKMSLDTSIKKNPNLYQASVGDMLKALRQRVDFIATREVPKFYEKNPMYMESFKNMQKQILELIPHVDEFENGFTNTIDKVMKLKQVKNH